MINKYKEDINKLKELGESMLNKNADYFSDNYQIWYSEALILIKQVLSDRVEDFIKIHKDIDNLLYNMGNEMYLADGKIYFRQLFGIFQSTIRVFESSLFNIKQLLQADLFDDELEAAKELAKKGFLRGAGAIVGVVLESHFQSVLDSHGINIPKKNPTINDYNELLKKEGIIETDKYRPIQRLGDLRNKCDHKKTEEPTKEDIDELINGAEKIIKTVF